MNLQTETLAKQAAEYAIEFATQDQELYIPKLMEKFAELIVRECIDIAQDRANFPGFPPNDVNDIIDEIKEHFGVEEQVQDSKELHTCPYRREIHNDYESLCDCDEDQQHQCAMDI